MLSLKTGEAVKYDGDAGITLAGGNASRLISGAARTSTSAARCVLVMNVRCDDLAGHLYSCGGVARARQKLHFQGTLPRSCCTCRRAMAAVATSDTRSAPDRSAVCWPSADTGEKEAQSPELSRESTGLQCQAFVSKSVRMERRQNCSLEQVRRPTIKQAFCLFITSHLLLLEYSLPQDISALKMSFGKLYGYVVSRFEPCRPMQCPAQAQ